MSVRSALGRNLPAVLAAAALVVTGGIASADLVAGGGDPTVLAGGSPSGGPGGAASWGPSHDATGSRTAVSGEPSSDPSVGSSVEPTTGPSVQPSVEPSGLPTEEPADGGGDGGGGGGGGVGPDPRGPAGYGLCTAWSEGGLGEGSTARQNLETAAGGPAGVEAFCATVVAEKEADRGGPGTSDEPDTAEKPQTTGKPDTPGKPGKPGKPEKARAPEGPGDLDGD